MKPVGLIVEYNPLHNGHILHLNNAKKLSGADISIAVMSGQFVQRGEPSIISKEEKVKAALNAGVDLIVELPFIYAVESADIFAERAIEILTKLNVKDFCFGSESGNTEEFIQKYNEKEFLAPRLDEVLRVYLKQGYSYPAAKSKALYDIHEFYLETPNDILGYAYLKAIEKHGYDIKPHIYKRENNEGSNELDTTYPSAKAIRNALKENKDVSNSTPIDFSKIDIVEFNDYFDLLKYKLCSSTAEELNTIHLVDEGIEYLMKKKIKEAKSMNEFIDLCTSKRYSGARIKRTIIHILNNTKKEEAKMLLEEPIKFIRVLGFNKKGAEYLSSIRKDIETPILNRFAGKDYPQLRIDLKASDIYYSILKEPKRNQEQQKELYLFPIK
ncbi:MAG: nucleotidyltransferase [Bacilli bacterium]|nr:nucleotidyltransferase [Bacilli bacterium]